MDADEEMRIESLEHRDAFGHAEGGIFCPGHEDIFYAGGFEDLLQVFGDKQGVVFFFYFDIQDRRGIFFSLTA